MLTAVSLLHCLRDMNLEVACTVCVICVIIRLTRTVYLDSAVPLDPLTSKHIDMSEIDYPPLKSSSRVFRL
jgi:hypothetical protein